METTIGQEWQPVTAQTPQWACARREVATTSRVSSDESHHALMSFELPASIANSLKAEFRHAGSTIGGGLIPYPSQGLPSATPHNPNSVDMEPSVQQLMLAKPASDMGAIQQMADLMAKSFRVAGATMPRLSYEFDVDEDQGPMLFMRLNTGGMDVEEQLRREDPMRQAIMADQRLASAKNYVVISIY